MRYTAYQLWKRLRAMRPVFFRPATCLTALLLTFLSLQVSAQSANPKITVKNDKVGSMMLVDGKPFMINGMNWDSSPSARTTASCGGRCPMRPSARLWTAT